MESLSLRLRVAAVRRPTNISVGSLTLWRPRFRRCSEYSKAPTEDGGGVIDGGSIFSSFETRAALIRSSYRRR